MYRNGFGLAFILQISSGKAHLANSRYEKDLRTAAFQCQQAVDRRQHPKTHSQNRP